MTLNILKQIIDNQMQMPEGRVWAYNNDVDLPKDPNLFIILFMTSQKPYANNIKYVPTSEGMNEVQTINLVQDVIISLVSKNTSARDRAYEIPLALNSTYSHNLQVKNKMHISTLGDIYDASFLESTTRLNRFDCKIRVFRAFDKINNVDYYDKFNFEIWTNGQNEKIIKTPFDISNETGE